MSNKPIDMFHIRQLLRFYADGSRATGIARNTIKKYLLRFVDLRLTIEDVEAMSAMRVEGPIALTYTILALSNAS